MSLWTFLDRNIFAVMLLVLGVVFALTDKKSGDGCRVQVRTEAHATDGGAP